jgi:hypothetical protein
MGFLLSMFLVFCIVTFFWLLETSSTFVDMVALLFIAPFILVWKIISLPFTIWGALVKYVKEG